jgi:hypothetical protein
MDVHYPGCGEPLPRSYYVAKLKMFAHRGFQPRVAALLLVDQALETNYAEMKTCDSKVQQLEKGIKPLAGIVTFVPIQIFAPQM